MIITRNDLDYDNYYIGENLSNYDGELSAKEGLGKIRFKGPIKVQAITFPHMTGLSSEYDVTSLGSISIRCGLRTFGNVFSWGSITVGEGIFTGKHLKAVGSIISNRTIIAKSIESSFLNSGEDILSSRHIAVQGDILSSRSIKAGEYIKGGNNIEALNSVQAGTYIDCQTIKAGVRIMAGVCTFHAPSEDEQEIRCNDYSGEIAHGKVVLKNEVCHSFTYQT